jgi:hypothetical protein
VRTKILAGIMMAGTAMSCTTERVVSPSELRAVSPTLLGGRPGGGGGGGGGNDCDMKYEECILLGRMTGGGGQVTIGDVYITRGFTIHCDILLSNNLEINWPGNKWHLDKPLTAANCVDDPAISPEPPPAPFDTFHGEGVGRLNGVDGSRVVFTFVDSGEPGGGNDKSAIQIFDVSGVEVLNVPLDFLTKGNLQAHFDQPHR